MALSRASIQTHCQSETFYAPAKIAGRSSLMQIVNLLQGNDQLHAFIDTVPGYAVVLNQERQIVLANKRFLHDLGFSDLESCIGVRLGNAVGCIHVKDGPGGCGTTEACTTCGAGTAIYESQLRHQSQTRECRISVDLESGSALDLEVISAPFRVGDHSLTLLTLRDISDEKRRRVLERIFFHDVLNTAGGIQGLSNLLLDQSHPIDDEEDLWFRQSIAELSSKLVNDIQSQREIAAAEAGELKTNISDIDVADIVEASISIVSCQEVSEGKRILFENPESMMISTDPNLMQRVLVNLIKNAVEATPISGTVKIWVEVDPNQGTSIYVNNPTVMPREVQLQVFQRSFTTKGGVGRGIGTYSIKLLGEKYLHGKVDFQSQEPEGTTFRFALPVSKPSDNGTTPQ